MYTGRSRCLKCGHVFEEETIFEGCPFCKTDKFVSNLTPIYELPERVENGTRESFRQRYPGDDLETYRENRELLCGILDEVKISYIHPDGAFYLFMKTPEPDAEAFCRRAMKENLLVVPGDSFGTPGYVRIAYCVSRDVIENALPVFRKLAEEYGIAR